MSQRVSFVTFALFILAVLTGVCAVVGSAAHSRPVVHASASDTTAAPGNVIWGP